MPEDVDFDKSVDKLADSILEEVKEGYDSQLESFDNYAEKTRNEIHANMDQFRNRFLKGYEILLDELTHQNKVKQNVEVTLPPYAIKL
jgi:hypothetical protein